MREKPAKTLESNNHGVSKQLKAIEKTNGII